jgi:signal transduction histidine kinase
MGSLSSGAKSCWLAFRPFGGDRYRQRALAILRLTAALAVAAEIPLVRRFAGPHGAALMAVAFGYAAISLGILIRVFVARRLPSSFFLVVNGIDILWPSLICLFTGCAASPFFLLFLLPLVAAPCRRNAVEVVLIALSSVLIVMSETAVAALPWFAWLHLLPGSLREGPLFFHSTIILLVGGFLAWSAYWAQRGQQACAAQSILRRMRSDAAVEKNLKEILPPVLEVFEAQRVVLVLRNSSTWRVFQWGASSHAEAQPARLDVPRSEERRYFWPMPAEIWSIACTRARGGFQAAALTRRGALVRIDSADFRPELLWEQPFRTLLATSLQFGSEWSGRLFVVDAPLSSGRESCLRLLQQIAAEVGPAVYNFYLWQHTSVRVRALERQRLARDLHDGVLQSLIASELQMELLRRNGGSPGQANALETLREAQDLLRSEVRKLRLQIEQLRSFAPPRQVLSYLEQLIETLQRETGIQATFVCNVDEAAIPRKLSTEIVHIVEEALNNVRKHSRARSVEVRLTAHQDVWEVVIQDDGLGFGFSGQLSLAQLDAAQQGPRVIRERVQLANGEMTLESYPNRGTRLKIRFAESF